MKLHGFILILICFVFGGCLKKTQPTSNNSKYWEDKFIGKHGIWYLNAFEINGVDSLLCIYPNSETNEEIRRLDFMLKSRTTAGYNGIRARDYLLCVEYENKNDMVIYNQNFVCDCQSKQSCMRDIFLQEKTGLTKMTWHISMPNKERSYLNAIWKGITELY